MMKYTLSLFTLLISSITTHAQGTCELKLADGKLLGNCKDSYITSFEIAIHQVELDSMILFSGLPLGGAVTVNNELEMEIVCELTNRAGFPQILFKAGFGWFTMDSLVIGNNSLTFKIDHDPDVPVTAVDLKIIRRAREFLKDEKLWHKNDDRDCEDDIERSCYSLFCALKSASIEYEGAYNHRNAIMQRIRHNIAEIFPDKEWEHRLRDFNNMPETDFNVLTDLLSRVEAEVASELALKK